MLLAAASLLAVACGDNDPPAPAPDPTVTASPSLRATATDDELVDVRIGDTVIRAETAITPEERSQGLSDRDPMAVDVGMLFVFEEERIPSFTMRRMRFPLDFIWVSEDGRIVDLIVDVPNPEAHGEEISGIQPAAPCRFVIEVNAGFVADNGIEIGDEVTFDRDLLAE